MLKEVISKLLADLGCRHELRKALPWLQGHLFRPRHAPLRPSARCPSIFLISVGWLASSAQSTRLYAEKMSWIERRDQRTLNAPHGHHQSASPRTLERVVSLRSFVQPIRFVQDWCNHRRSIFYSSPVQPDRAFAEGIAS